MTAAITTRNPTTNHLRVFVVMVIVLVRIAA
jgi:hypothetical protein